MRILHGCRKTVVAVQVDSGRLRVESQALLQGVLEHGPALRNALSRIFLDLIGRVPLHAQQPLHWVRARLLHEPVLHLLANRTLLLTVAIDLTVRVVVAVSAELR